MYRIVLIAILFYSTIFGQNSEKEVIINSKAYYYGNAIEQDLIAAEDLAFDRILRNISDTLSSTFQKSAKENQNEGVGSLEQIIKTYSEPLRKNVKEVIESINEGFDVLLYIPKSDIDKIFEYRRRLVRNLYKKAVEFDNTANFAYALKSYYFAIILMNSLPELNVVCENNLNLKTEITLRINRILKNTRFELVSDSKLNEKEREVCFNIFVGDKKAKSLIFTFKEGVNQVTANTLDGFAMVGLYGNNVGIDTLDFRIKYQYYESKDEIEEVGELWSLINKPTFTNYFQVALSPKIEISKKEQGMDKKYSKDTLQGEKQNFQEQINSITHGKFQLRLKNTDNCNLVDSISKEALILLELINRVDTAAIQKYYAKDEYILNRIMSILKYNNLKIIEKSIYSDLNKTYNGWEIRKILVSNTYKSLKKQTPDYLILDFDKQGNLYDINFGIYESLYGDFVEQGNIGCDWDKRQVIIKFMEKYRTTFLTRDLNTIDSLFSEGAVIIVGRVLQKNKNKDVKQYYEQLPNVDYIRINKEKYLERLKKVFDEKNDIYVGYSTFQINKKNKPPVFYGISMRQDYLSTGYSDEGYLFLLVDFENNLPQIYVRSWQPQEWNEKDLIKLSNFNIN
ncbi:MAG: hypothetical protein V1720_08525 [bacterium]